MAITTTVSANFGTKKNPDVRNIKFKAFKKSVRVTVKGMPTLAVYPSEQAGFVVMIAGKAASGLVTAKTPEAAYKKAVKAFWK
jgi:hypothetical protein